MPNDNIVEFVHSLEPEVVVGLVDEELGSKPPLSEAEKKNATILISLETFEISLSQIVREAAWPSG